MGVELHEASSASSSDQAEGPKPTSTPGTPRSTYDNELNFQSDVAVIGMACRLPGDNDTPEDLWRSMINKKDASGDIPEMRWEPYYRRDPRNAKELKKTTSKGYFLSRLEDFDAAFFGISPKEAEQMDPQQRISLEVAWEALEDAGIAPKSLAGSDTAVFMGVNSDDYSKLLLEDIPNVEAWMGIGTAYCGVPNRISYHLDLNGPSTAVDAACASSLVAIHHGRQAILCNESKIAIVGGVNALCGPGLTRVLDKAGAVSPDGACMSFDDDAHGYGRGEGAAIVILKRLSDAIEDQDNVLALLKGSAVAQDGRTNGIMAPNAKAQQLVAQQALRCARVEPASVQYVEAHATSTPLGDPTEVSAVSSVYGVGRETKPVYVGSVKANIGHLEAGAGSAGFIKAVLAMREGVMPPRANLKTLNSKINWEKCGVKVVQEATKWPEVEEARRAAICSYGYGGTVSHAVIEEFGNVPLVPWVEPTGPQMLVLSAPREDRLKAQASVMSQWLSGDGHHHSLRKVCTTLASRREHHDFRLAIVAHSIEKACESLKAFAAGAPDALTTSTRAMPANITSDPVWVFSGHGSQWPDMGKELLHNSVFFEAVSRLESIVQAEMDFSALKALASGDIEVSEKVQVLCYVMQIGLSALLHSKGMKPAAVIGHSIGEIAASVEAGCLTDLEGALIVTRRAKLYKQVKGSGSMVLVNIPYKDVQTSLGERTDIVAAIDSSPSSCVVSGETKALAVYVEGLKASGIKALAVNTNIPFHSPVLDPLVGPLSDMLQGSFSARAPRVSLYSTSDLDPRSLVPRDVTYWTRNMVKPVYLTAAVKAAIADGMTQFMEVSSHPIVSHSVTETLMDAGLEEFSVVPTMLRNKPAESTILSSIGKLFCKGAKVDWTHLLGREWDSSVPGTKWMHKPYWRTIQTGASGAGSTHDVDKHTLLGQRNALAGRDIILYTSKLDDATKPFPGNHPLHGTEIVPAAALVNTFHHATNAPVLSNIVLRVPVAISAPRDIQVLVEGDGVKICSRLMQAEGTADADSVSWLTHTTGHWSHSQPTPSADTVHIDAEVIKKRIAVQLADSFSIDYLDKVGVSAMGFPWAITEHYGNLDEMIARVDVAPALAATGPLPWDASSWAPVLDAATSVGSTLFFDNPKLRMPAAIGKVQFFKGGVPPKVGYLFVQRDTETDFSVHVTVSNEKGEPLVAFRSMRFSEIEGTPGVSGSMESLVHQMAWPPAKLIETPMVLESVVLVATDSPLAAQYKQQLTVRGSSVSLISSASEVASLTSLSSAKKGKAAIIYVPGTVQSKEDIPADSERFIAELLDLVKFTISNSLPHKVFVLTERVFAGETNTALAQAPLQGLCRIIASEHPDQWGAMIDTETQGLPMLAMRYISGEDVIRIVDDVPRIARLRPLPRETLYETGRAKTMSPRPEGSYLISGGLGALGLEVADYLVEKGARRLVLLSRRELPPRNQWSQTPENMAAAVTKMQQLEKRGASVYVVSHDLGSDISGAGLSAALEKLSIPPVLGVVHAAGVLEDQLVMETTRDSFSRVLKPKVSGALALHELFPAGSLDFFVLFSSCGQLFGFPGQSSYASGNAFLDTLATHRRAAGDNAVAFQWTSWHGMGMAASTDFISAELASKGITDVSRDEAFRAWEHLSRFDLDHGVVLRSLAFDEGEPLPVDILADIAVRRPGTGGAGAATAANSGDVMPPPGPERKAYLDCAIRECVASVLMASGIEDVDPRAALADMGLDSVMTVGLRRQLQSRLKVKVPPTLTWSHPTVNHLTDWFMDKVSA